MYIVYAWIKPVELIVESIEFETFAIVTIDLRY